MPLTTEHFAKCCRWCLDTTGKMNPLFNSCLDQIFLSLFSLQIQKDDAYPQQVCKRCIVKLNTAFNFHQMVVKSYNALTDILQASKQRNEKTPTEQDFKQVKDIFSTVNSIQSTNIQTTNIQSTNIQSTNNSSTNHAAQEKEERLVLEHDRDEIYTVKTKETEFEDTREMVGQSTDHDYVCKSKLHDLSLYYDGDKGDVGIMSEGKIAVERAVQKKCQYCQYGFADCDGLKEHLRVHKVKCELCHRMIYEDRIKQHHLSHSEEKSFQCNVCHHTFATKLRLQRHFSEYHRRKKRAICLCSHCGATFSTQSGLSRHKSVHTGRNLRICDICTKHFLTRHSLVEHLQSHVGVKPYPCARCQISFTQVSSLRKHTRLLHTADGRYRCAVCELVFDTRVGLNEHKRSSHGRSRCYRCKITFQDANSLVAHNNDRHPKSRKPTDSHSAHRKSQSVNSMLTEVLAEPSTLDPLTCECGTRLASNEHLQEHLTKCAGLQATR